MRCLQQKQRLSFQRRLGPSLIKLSLFFLLTASAYADVTQQSGNVLIQNVTSPELDVFCNQKDTALVLDRVNFDNPGVQAGWSSSLPAHMCSVFFTDKSPFTFACRQEAPGSVNAISCHDVLLASRLPWSGQVIAPPVMAGSYWIVENATPDELIIMLRRKNIDT